MRSKKVALPLVAVLLVGAGVAGVLVANNRSGNDDNTSQSQRSPAVQSPTVVIKDFQNYLGKDIAVKGRIIQSGADTYYVVGEEAKSPGGIKLDFSKSSIDPKKYTDTMPADTPAAPATPEANPTASNTPAIATASPKKAAAASSDTKAPDEKDIKDAVVVTGRLTQSKDSSQPVLVVTAIR